MIDKLRSNDGFEPSKAEKNDIIKNFDNLKETDLFQILDNLFDKNNDHGVMVAHDAAVKDSGGVG